MFRYGKLSQLSLAGSVCSLSIGVMGTMYLEAGRCDEYGSSVSSLTAGSTAITHELIRRTKVNVCSVAATAFHRSGRLFDIPFVVPLLPGT